MLVVYLCRTVLYGLDISHRACVYLLGVLVISLFSDYITPSADGNYFAQTDNFLNLLFAKWAWLWTCLLLSCLIYITSNTSTSGRGGIIKNYLARLAIASMVWYSVTTLFQVVESKTGVCEFTEYEREESCVSHGHHWRGFDLSGHCFLLIFCNLLMLEEGKLYLGWEIRTEELKRVTEDVSRSDTPLSKLKNEEIEYTKNTPVVRLLFCLMVVLMVLWDFMLLITALYHHRTSEKVLASGVAVLAWLSLYKMFYKLSFSPALPGEGINQVALIDSVTGLCRRQV